jgi:hypothetical protein
MINFYDDSCFNHYAGLLEDEVINSEADDQKSAYYDILEKITKYLSQTPEYKIGRIIINGECEKCDEQHEANKVSVGPDSYAVAKYKKDHKHPKYDKSTGKNIMNSVFFTVTEILERIQSVDHEFYGLILKYVGLIHEYRALQKTTRHSVYEEFETKFHNETLEYLNKYARCYDTKNFKLFDKYKKIVIPTIIEPKSLFDITANALKPIVNQAKLSTLEGEIPSICLNSLIVK